MYRNAVQALRHAAELKQQSIWLERAKEQSDMLQQLGLTTEFLA